MNHEPLDESTGEDRVAELAAWKQRYEDDNRNPSEQFKQLSNIAVCMSYDLIDKMRFYEKSTLDLSDDEIRERIPHMAAFLDRLKSAYLQFADADM